MAEANLEIIIVSIIISIIIIIIVGVTVGVMYTYICIHTDMMAKLLCRVSM